MTLNLTFAVLCCAGCLLAAVAPLADAASGGEKATPAPPRKATLPDTPAGRQFGAWLKALNAGDRSALRAFHAGAGAADPDRLAGQDVGLFERTGGLEPYSVTGDGDHKISAILYARLPEAWLSLSFAVAPAAPHPVVGIGLRPGSAPPEVAARQRRLPDAEVARTLDAYVQRLVAADAFSGTVTLAKDGKPLFSKAYGLAHKGYQVPNRVDTKFNLGSMNKMFTAVAVAQLVEAGKLRYEDTVGKHLPDYPNADVRDKVSVHHLLTHTSGLQDYFNDEYMKTSKDRFKTVADFLPLFRDKPLAFAPGERFGYSNAGFMLLGALIEKVSGRDYFDYVREHIFRPAGMTDTDAYELDQDTPNLAFGYTRSAPDASGKRAWKNNLFLHVVKGGPAGGGFSTAADLLRFAQALRTGKLLRRAESAENLYSGKVAAGGGGGTDDRYGYGFDTSLVNGQRVTGHSGGFPGINSNLDIFLDSGYTVAVMSNYDPPAAQFVANKARELLTAKK